MSGTGPSSIWAIARKAIDTLLTQSAEELKASEGMSELQLKLLDSAVSFYEQFPADVSARPEIRYETAVMYSRVAELCTKVGKTEYRDKGLDLLDRAIQMLETLAAEDPTNAPYRLLLIRDRLLLSRLHQYIAEYDHNYNRIDPDLTQRAVALARELIASDTTSALYRETLADALAADYGYSTFDPYRRRKPTPAQLENLAQASDLFTKLVDEFPTNQGYRSRLAAISTTYSMALRNVGEFDQADAVAARQLEVVRSLVSLDPNNVSYEYELARLLYSRIDALRDRSRHDEADALSGEAIEIMEKLCKRDPDDFLKRGVLLQLVGTQIDSFVRRKKFAEASQLQPAFLHLRRMEQTYDPANPQEDSYLRQTLYTYALCLNELGRAEEAREAFADCLKVAQQGRPQRHGEYAKLDEKGGYIAIRASCPFEDLRDDQAIYELALANLRGIEIPGSRLSSELITLGLAACRLGRWQEALQAFDTAHIKDVISGRWTEAELAAAKAIALDRTGQKHESLRHLILAHHALRDGENDMFPGQLLRGRSLLREALAICQREQPGAMVFVDRLIHPQDNDGQDLNLAQRSVAVGKPQSCFRIATAHSTR